MLQAINAFLNRQHPQFTQSLSVKPPTHRDMYTGRYLDGKFTLQQGERKIVDEAQVLAIMEGDSQSNNVVVIQDDYLHWRNHNYQPFAGKPLFVTDSDSEHHHIFFDDNLHNLVDDSIVGKRLNRKIFCANFLEKNCALVGCNSRAPSLFSERLF